MPELDKLEAKVDQLLVMMTAVEKKLEIYIASHTENHRGLEKDLDNLMNEMYGEGQSPGMKGLLRNQINLCSAMQAAKPKTPSMCREAVAKIMVNVTSGVCLAFIFWVVFVYKHTQIMP